MNNSAKIEADPAWHRMRAKLERDLRSYFHHISLHGPIDGDHMVPREVTEALHGIMHCYNPLMKSLVAMSPCHPMRRFSDPEDLYWYAWQQFFQYSAKIRNQTAKGVGQWLKRVVINRRVRIHTKNLSEIKTTEYFENRRNGNPSVELERFYGSQIIAAQSDDAMDPEEANFRLHLLEEFQSEGLSLLNPRQRVILEYSYDGHALSDIMRLMQFSSIDAVKAFKKRAKKALAEKVLQLFREEIQSTHADTRRQEIIGEWLITFGNGTEDALL